MDDVCYGKRAQGICVERCDKNITANNDTAKQAVVDGGRGACDDVLVLSTNKTWWRTVQGAPSPSCRNPKKAIKATAIVVAQKAVEAVDPRYPVPTHRIRVAPTRSLLVYFPATHSITFVQYRRILPLRLTNGKPPFLVYLSLHRRCL